MDTAQIIKKLRNFRMKWRREQTRERKFQNSLIEQNKPYSPALEKSVGIDIGYGMCAHDIDKLIKELETMPG